MPIKWTGPVSANDNITHGVIPSNTFVRVKHKQRLLLFHSFPRSVVMPRNTLLYQIQSSNSFIPVPLLCSGVLEHKELSLLECHSGAGFGERAGLYVFKNVSGAQTQPANG